MILIAQYEAISRAWRETVVTKNPFWKSWFRGNFDPFVNNANLEQCRTSKGTEISIVYQEKWFNAYIDFMARWLTLVKIIQILVTTVLRQAIDI